MRFDRSGGYRGSEAGHPSPFVVVIQSLSFSGRPGAQYSRGRQEGGGGTVLSVRAVELGEGTAYAGRRDGDRGTTEGFS